MGHERKFSGEHPPFAGECKKSALHFGQLDIMPTADFADMLRKARTECPAALGGAFRRLADIDQIALK